MKTAFVVAMDENGLIGKDNDLPWRLSADLQYFRRITMGKPILMGRKTHASIGRPLPGRHNIVVSSMADYQADGCDVVRSIEEALKLENSDHAELEGDTWFPQWDQNQWKLISRESFPADEKNDYAYSFEVYERI